MEQTKKDLIVEQLNKLMAASSCCAEAKAAAQRWLDAVGTENEETETAALAAELKEDIVTIDGFIAFLSSPRGESIFGAEGAAAALVDAKAAKEAGARYCTCPACAACEAILTALGEI